MSRAFYLFFGFLLILVIVVLLWAVDTHEKTVDSLPSLIAREFQPLLQSEKPTDLNLGLIETRVKAIYQDYPYVEELILRKFNPTGTVITIYPFSYDLDHPQFPPKRDYAYRVKTILGADRQPQGIVYVKISAQRTLLFNSAIIGSMAALIIVCFVGLYTIQSKEKEVQQTTTLLEEKQRELIHLERLALVGQVTANLLHDLKKPVLNIKAESDAIADPEIRKIIRDEADLFLGMVRELQLESFLRKSEDRAEFVDVEEVIHRSLRLVKYAQKNVFIALELQDNLPLILGHRHKLIQVFSNLFLNAMQALDGEGMIRVNGSLYTENEKASLEIGITDDGPGIPYEILSRIFE
ncbi:MAG: ATP-binding protein, partial [bacterium]|nr:ATP-binding protein [bacterium]